MMTPRAEPMGEKINPSRMTPRSVGLPTWGQHYLPKVGHARERYRTAPQRKGALWRAMQLVSFRFAKAPNRAEAPGPFSLNRHA